MTKSTDEELQELLWNISTIARDIIIQNLKNGILQPERHYKDCMSIQDFRYETTGAVYNNSTHYQQQVISWDKACFQVADILHKSAEYSAAKIFISKHYANSLAVYLYDQYIYKSFQYYFDKPSDPDETAINQHILKFIRHIKHEAHIATATVYIIGLVLESKKLTIADNVILRQTIKSDLERINKPIDHFFYQAIPSAVLEIQMHIKRDETVLLQETVEYYLNLLRLFDVGSVDYTQYYLQFDTEFTPSGQISTPHNINHVWKQYRLTKTHEAQFLNYNSSFILPKSLYRFEKTPDFLTTAFDRYKEAILERAPIERRIANTIMGVEAILSNDNQELAFKMQTRTAKILSLFDFDSLTVRTHMSKSYSIRSKYAHGGFLNQKSIRDLEKHVGNLQDFSWTIVDYLRILIIMISAANISKDILLMLVDDALIDLDSAQKLKQTLEPVKSICIRCDKVMNIISPQGDK